MHTQLLAAIRGLTDRVTILETQPQRAETDRSAGTSPGHLPAFQEQHSRHADAISLYAQGSLLGGEKYQGKPEGVHSDASSHQGVSTSGGDGTEDASEGIW